MHNKKPMKIAIFKSIREFLVLNEKVKEQKRQKARFLRNKARKL